MVDAESAELLARWQSGDEDAAEALYRRYAEQLVALAQKNLPHRMMRRFDAEDVVQSAFRNFFGAARDRQFTIQRSGDLWRLLATITMNRLYRNIEHHSAQRRSILREAKPPENRDGLRFEHLAAGPSTEDAVALAEELDLILAELDPLKRLMLELRLQDYTLEEIASHTRRSERSVRRSLDQIKEMLECRTLGRTA